MSTSPSPEHTQKIRVTHLTSASDLAGASAALVAAHEEFAPFFGGRKELARYMAASVEAICAASPDRRVVGAMLADAVVGTITWVAPGGDSGSRHTTPPGWARLRGLAVNPEYRRQGIGALLLREGLRLSVGSGAPWVCLGSWSVMKAAARCYSKMGFERWPEFDWTHDIGAFLVLGYRLRLDN